MIHNEIRRVSSEIFLLSSKTVIIPYTFRKSGSQNM